LSPPTEAKSLLLDIFFWLKICQERSAAETLPRTPGELKAPLNFLARFEGRRVDKEKRETKERKETEGKGKKKKTAEGKLLVPKGYGGDLSAPPGLSS